MAHTMASCWVKCVRGLHPAGPCLGPQAWSWCMFLTSDGIYMGLGAVLMLGDLVLAMSRQTLVAMMTVQAGWQCTLFMAQSVECKRGQLTYSTCLG